MLGHILGSSLQLGHSNNWVQLYGLRMVILHMWDQLNGSRMATFSYQLFGSRMVTFKDQLNDLCVHTFRDHKV